MNKLLPGAELPGNRFMELYDKVFSHFKVRFRETLAPLMGEIEKGNPGKRKKIELPFKDA
ncbi:hypothetical protein GCM10011340_14860 [Roseivirga thermotolerans]|uniref:DDE transposase n=1 Tax=Roseivirga thermotolerans TaxID=1758176 RepID=A0ABQ3I426_9BACT|nr:hypothetical protein GCM10011340_14860 [Roseivirga thermotolerans]